MTMMPVRNSGYAAPRVLNITALAVLLTTTDPELHAPGQLPGETLLETAARRQAAADITDEILFELGSAA